MDERKIRGSIELINDVIQTLKKKLTAQEICNCKIKEVEANVMECVEAAPN